MNNNPRQRSCCYPHFTSCGRMNMAPQMLCTLILKVVRMLFHMTKRDLQKWGRILSRRDDPSCLGKPNVIRSCKKLARVSRAEKAKEWLKQRVKDILWLMLEKKKNKKNPKGTGSSRTPECIQLCYRPWSKLVRSTWTSNFQNCKLKVCRGGRGFWWCYGSYLALGCHRLGMYYITYP